jgi:hypothetical protein
MGDIDVIIGGGEVGSTIYEIMKNVQSVAVVDLDKSKQKLPDDKEDLESFRNKKDVRILHICFTFTSQDTFVPYVLDYIKEYDPSVVVIHSTVSRGTTTKVAEQTDKTVIFSATRGVHKRFREDMEYYTKFWATESTDRKAINIFRQGLSDAGFKLKQMSKPDTLELAKLLTDTTYYGVLISYAQKTKVICDKYGVDYDEMWQFSEEGHAKIGNRPKMFPGFIGGHCVIPNLDLLDEEVYDEFKYIDEHNKFYKSYLEDKKNETS